ncbi:MAG: TonB-dependent receptor plug domain-containing protein [Alphaproteobacteria bacterium]
MNWVKVHLLGVALSGLAAAEVAAQMEVVPNEPGEEEVITITGSLTPRPAKELGSAISILDETFIDATQNIIVSDILRTIPGLAVNRTGPQGNLTQVRIRGAEGNQTLVIIDGVEAANPVFGEFNFANLVSADIERIEVIRGPQSALYGSEAIGGVISVITKNPEPGLNGEVELEGGSFGTYRGFAALSGGTELFGLRGTVQYYDTDGISASPTGTEDDGFDNLTASVKGLFTPSSRLTVEGVVRYSDSEVETDAQEFDFGTVQDAGNTAESEDLIAKIDATGALLGDWLTGRAYVAYTDTEVVNFTDGAETSFSRGDRLDLGLRFTAEGTFQNTKHSLTAAFEREEVDFENINQSQDDQQTSIVGEYNFGYDDRVFLSFAVRQDFNDVFQDATTYRASGAWLIPTWGTRFHASWGEGVTDPTFNERFGFDPGTFIGNPDLVPERSQGWDIGIEQAFFGGRAVIDITYFNANLEDEISTSFSFVDGSFISTPINNPGESERQGVEVVLNADLYEGLSLTAQYTYLDATGADGLIEVRRPEHIASANLFYSALANRLTVNLGVDYNGEQEDLFFGFADPDFTPRRTLDAYTLVRLAASYQVTEYVQLFARGENIFDAEYEEVLGFNATGAAGFVGVRLTY